jgi:hypothetical protein
MRPSNAGRCAAGYYLLFAINQAGTPSIGRIAKIGVAGAAMET